MKVRGYRIFYIEEDASIKDIIDLIESTTAVKMALVIKNSQLLLNSSVNLKLLKKYSRRYKKELVFINPEPVNVDQINREGFQIYENLITLERDLPLYTERPREVYTGEELYGGGSPSLAKSTGKRSVHLGIERKT